MNMKKSTATFFSIICVCVIACLFSACNENGVSMTGSDTPSQNTKVTPLPQNDNFANGNIDPMRNLGLILKTSGKSEQEKADVTQKIRAVFDNAKNKGIQTDGSIANTASTTVYDSVQVRYMNQLVGYTSLFLQSASKTLTSFGDIKAPFTTPDSVRRVSIGNGEYYTYTHVKYTAIYAASWNNPMSSFQIVNFSINRSDGGDLDFYPIQLSIPVGTSGSYVYEAFDDNMIIHPATANYNARVHN